MNIITKLYFSSVLGALVSLLVIGSSAVEQIHPGSRLLAGRDGAWISDNGTFAFGFCPVNSRNDQFELGIWFAQLPGNRTLVWSAEINSPASREATLDFDLNGNLVLKDGSTTLWASNTSNLGVETAFLSENGNLILYGPNETVAWQSFSHPSDTLLPGQPLTGSLRLKSAVSHGGYYTLTMLQQPTSLNLALTFNLPDFYDEYSTNYSYWSGPDVSNVTGDVTAVLNEEGSFGIVFGSLSDGAVYVFKNENDNGGLSDAINMSNTPSVLRRIILETSGNLRLFRWDNEVNGSRQWVAEWAAVSRPCDIAGICGNGICNLDRSETSTSCTCLHGTSKSNSGDQCYGNSSGKCGLLPENQTSEFKISVVNQTNYYFTDSSVIANYSDIDTVSKCGDACLADCECVASVSGLNDDQAYCWILRKLEFGGYPDPSSTLFVKVESSGYSTESGKRKKSDAFDGPRKEKVLVLPIVLTMAILLGLLFCLLYINVRKKRILKRALQNSLIVSGTPVNFSYRDLQYRTSNFSQLLGTGGFGSVYRGSLDDGTLIAVKRLDRILPHGEKEFITEVNTIGSMHHKNLVRLCGYCSEGSYRLLVYEFMKNGSLDKWIFPSSNPTKARERLLDWSTRFHVAISIAQGIAYFHEQCRDRIIHCDIKPENILLDENFCPKVSDFGLAKLMGREVSQVVTMVRGTRGYLAPEWVSNRPITVKADVYSYGMLLLEIIGGRRNLDMTCGAEDFFFPGWAFKEMTNGTAIKVADRRLEGSVQEEEFMRCLKVSFWCIQDEISMRPSMGDVVKMLEGAIDIKIPPLPQTVSDMIEEGLDNVYKAMKTDFNQYTCFTNVTSHLSSRATCSYSTTSPR